MKMRLKLPIKKVKYKTDQDKRKGYKQLVNTIN